MVFKEVPGQIFVEKIAKKLFEEYKDTIKPPEWAFFVKTGPDKERPPDDPADQTYDGQPGWWYYRAASILRQIAIRGPIGVSRLRTRYGGIRKVGYWPGRFRKGYAKIIREIIHQLEKAGLVQYVETPKKGRVLTKQGFEFLKGIVDEIKLEIATKQ